MANEIDELIKELRTNQCTCDSAWTSRSLTDPRCHYCEYKEVFNDAADAIEKLQQQLADKQKEVDALNTLIDEVMTEWSEFEREGLEAMEPFRKVIEHDYDIIYLNHQLNGISEISVTDIQNLAALCGKWRA